MSSILEGRRIVLKIKHGMKDKQHTANGCKVWWNNFNEANQIANELGHTVFFSNRRGQFVFYKKIDAVARN